jgi:ornithine cyclodeaminase
VTVPGYSAEQLTALLTWPAAIAALREALSGGLDPEREPARVAFPFGAGELLTMPSSAGPIAGVKLVTIAPERPDRSTPRIHGVYVLFDADTLAPIATLDGAALTAIRTPAVSALGVELVAPLDAHRLLVFGAGPQARGHVHALRAVRPIGTVRIVGRDADRADRLVESLRTEGIDATVGSVEDVRRADVIACCTTARTPLFDGRELPDAAVVVAVGSHEPAAREIDAETVRRCGAVVEARGAALAEAGDIRLAVDEGAISPDDLVTLADLVRGRAARRPRLVKTVGMGWQDLVVAGAAVAAAGVRR